MAFLQVDMLSASLMRAVSVNVLLPVDKLGVPASDKPLKTLYLLHGYLGNQMDWVINTRLRLLAQEHDLCVVMPAGENAFYIDRKDSRELYGDFIGRELVELTRRMFPLSHKREDTFIGGLSMGGYGALRNGLKYHDTFGAIAALSGAFLLEQLQHAPEEAPNPLQSRRYYSSIFGDLDTVMESDRNPKFLAKRLAESGDPKPAVYIACGEQDGLLPASRDMADTLKALGYDVTYAQGPGGHEWKFWDEQIEKVLNWLPTDTAARGFHSGNVGL